MGAFLSAPEEPTRKLRSTDEPRKTLPNGKPAPLVCPRCYKTVPCEHSDAEDIATLASYGVSTTLPTDVTNSAAAASSGATAPAVGGNSAAAAGALSQLSFSDKDAENVHEVRRKLPTQQLINNMMILCDSLLKSYDTIDANKLASYSAEYEHLKKQADLLTKHHVSLQANKGKGSVGQEVLDLHFKQVDKLIDRCDRFNQMLCGGDQLLDEQQMTGADTPPPRNEVTSLSSSSSLAVMPYSKM